MKQEDKELLLKDLCARLLYGVKVNRLGIVHKLISINSADKTVTIDNNNYMPTTFFVSASEIPIKPYLRPLSSMTEEEQKEFVGFHCVTLCPIIMKDCLTIENEGDMFDWLNRHHFDYRNLIEKNLAIEAPEGMYKKE